MDFSATLRSPISTPLSRALFFGLIVGLCGVLIGFSPLMLDMEDNFGLDLLFWLRGSRRPPGEVVVVAIDKKSCFKLKMPDNPDQWPRSMHARLVDNLKNMGARVIAFDFHFLQAGPEGNDLLFANALENAHNVVLCDFVKSSGVELITDREEVPDDLGHQLVIVEKPFDILTKKAAATAPFLLPGTSYKVRYVPLFIDIAGGIPTLPLVAFQLYSLPDKRDFFRLVRAMTFEHSSRKAQLKTPAFPAGDSLERTMADLHELMHKSKGLQHPNTGSIFHRPTYPGQRNILKSLCKIYRSPRNERFINFYGPPGSISTIPYCKLVLPPDPNKNDKPPDLRGKAVFVGASKMLAAERRDTFHTAFSAADTTDTSGVEVAATIFANLLEDSSLIPIPNQALLLFLFGWGWVLGTTTRLYSLRLGGAIMLQASISYLIFSFYLFQKYNLWLPLFTPAVALPLMALLGTAVLNHLHLFRQSRAMSSLQRDLSHARSLQQGMLPVVCPPIPGLQIAAHCLPSGVVGGDFFDFHEVEPGKLGICIGDVTGKNLSGALVVSATQSVLKMLCEQGNGPAETLNRANN
ncbi:MAG: CHASE2 domain-containing protein, partial [Desulfobulbaceae bacterium]|nr:CHASE2 domain-containing protein [Desulfobulbaceae bacterium]